MFWIPLFCTAIVKPVMIHQTEYLHSKTLFILTYVLLQVLVQGVVLNQANIDEFLQSVNKKLETLECTLAENFGKLVENSSVSIVVNFACWVIFHVMLLLSFADFTQN